MNTPLRKRDYWPTQEWQTMDLKSAGIDPQGISDLENMIHSQYRNINGMVIIRKGRIAYEKYFNNYSLDDTHSVASVTKSITSALIGIAISKGYIQSVDQKVLDFFPEYVTGVHDFTKRIITIKHLLTMTTPFAWKTMSMKTFEPLDRLRRQKNWVSYTLDQMGLNGQIGQFQYSTAGAHLLSAIITRATGMCAREFANLNLFQPIGMREIPDHTMKSFQLEEVFGKNVVGWIKDPQGNTTGGWGLTITLRDMARFGYLYLNHGLWNNTQIIPKKWIEESVALNPNKYGYMWWLRNEAEVFAYSALGAGGNVICCIPKKDLVVAIVSKIVRKPRDPWLIFEKCIIPAIKDR